MCGLMAAAATAARWITVLVLCVSIRCAVGLRGACFHRQRGVNGCSGARCRSTSAWTSSPPPRPPPRSSPARTARPLHTAARNPTLSIPPPPSTLPKKTLSLLPRENQDHHHHHHHPRRARVRLRGGGPGNHDRAHESLFPPPESAPHFSQGGVGRRASSDDIADGGAGGLSQGRYRLRLHHHRHPPSRKTRQSRLRLRAVERSEVVEPMVESGAGHAAGVVLGEQAALGGVTVLSLTDVHTVTDVVITDEKKLRPTVDALGRGRARGGGAGAAASDAGSASSLRWGAMVASPAAAAAVVEVAAAAAAAAAAAGVEGVVVGTATAAAAAGGEAAEMVVLGAPAEVGMAEGIALEAAAAAPVVEEAAVVAAGEGVVVVAAAAAAAEGVVAAVGEAKGVVVEAGVVAGGVAVAASRQGQGGPRREEDAEQEQEQEEEQEREDERFMRMALRLAERAGKAGEVPVGAVLTESVAGGGGVGGGRRRRVLATGRNDVERRKDASAHAEMLCLQAAAKARHNWRLGGGTLYVTMEPCVMCLSAAQLFRVDRVVFGAPNPNLGACGGWIDLPGHKHAFHELDIRGGVLAEECALPLRGFFRSRRREGVAPGKRSPQAAGGVGGVARGGGGAASGAAIPEGEGCSRIEQIRPSSPFHDL